MLQQPLMLVSNFTLEQFNVLQGRCSVEVNDQGKRVVLVKEQGIVLVEFNHISNGILVFVHCGFNPPTFFFNN